MFGLLMFVGRMRLVWLSFGLHDASGLGLYDYLE